jgi:Rox3 mediator complex subunit
MKTFGKIWVAPSFLASRVRLSFLLSCRSFARTEWLTCFIIAIPRSRLDPSTHLLSRFGLGPLVRTVARNDPVTGEKINKLRKSYEGQVKNFALSGRNKPVKMEALENGKRPLRSMVEDTTEEEWADKYEKRPIEATPDFKAKLQIAMQMQPGTVRNNLHWDDVLGHERQRPVVTAPVAATNPTFTAAPSRQTNGITMPNVQAGANAVRPKRAGKKRSYVDDSFEGYGEGFGDDDGELDDGAFDDDEDGGGSARKKRKKVLVEE